MTTAPEASPPAATPPTALTKPRHNVGKVCIGGILVWPIKSVR